MEDERASSNGGGGQGKGRRGTRGRGGEQIITNRFAWLQLCQHGAGREQGCTAWQVKIRNQPAKCLSPLFGLLPAEPPPLPAPPPRRHAAVCAGPLHDPLWSPPAAAVAVPAAVPLRRHPAAAGRGGGADGGGAGGGGGAGTQAAGGYVAAGRVARVPVRVWVCGRTVRVWPYGCGRTGVAEWVWPYGRGRMGAGADVSVGAGGKGEGSEALQALFLPSPRFPS